MKERLQLYALIAEIAGGIAIVLSLLFVGFQIRQNSQAQIQTNTQAVVSDWGNLFGRLSTDPILSCIYNKGVQDYASLNDTERTMFSAYMLTAGYIFQQMLYLERDGDISEEIWSGVVSMTVTMFQQPGMIAWFDQRRSWFSSGYQQFVIDLRNAESTSEIPVVEAVDCID